MNRKHNPMLSLVALLLAAIILVLTCAGCGIDTEAAERNAHHAAITEATETETTAPAAEPAHLTRFEIDWEPGGGWHVNGIYVITDNHTGVQYLYIKDANGGGLTALLPGEG